MQLIGKEIGRVINIFCMIALIVCYDHGIRNHSRRVANIILSDKDVTDITNKLVLDADITDASLGIIEDDEIKD